MQITIAIPAQLPGEIRETLEAYLDADDARRIFGDVLRLTFHSTAPGTHMHALSSAAGQRSVQSVTSASMPAKRYARNASNKS